jgi:predicted permease
VVLVPAAGLLLRSFSSLRSTAPGFVADSVAVGRVTLDENAYSEDPQVVAYFDRLLEGLRELPGVEAAGAVTTLPLSPVGIDFEIPYDTGRGEAVDEDRAPQVAFRVVTPGYFEALGTRILEGRDFDRHDRDSSEKVVIVNRRMARTAWPGKRAIGQRLGLFDSGPSDFSVVGVVEDVRHYGLGLEPRPELFVPQPQHPWYSSFYVVLRTAPEPETLLEAVRREVLAVDPGQPIADLTTMPRLVAGSLARERFLTVLLGLMAGLALFLALTGVFAVLSYGVAQRRHEIGVRMAIGARRGEVLGLVLREGLAIALAGLALGLIGARLTTRTLASFLYGVGGGDPVTYLAVAALILIAALAACIQPARRAAKSDPVAALRQ